MVQTTSILFALFYILIIIIQVVIVSKSSNENEGKEVSSLPPPTSIAILEITVLIVKMGKKQKVEILGELKYGKAYQLFKATDAGFKVTDQKQRPDVAKDHHLGLFSKPAIFLFEYGAFF